MYEDDDLSATPKATYKAAPMFPLYSAGGRIGPISHPQRRPSISPSSKYRYHPGPPMARPNPRQCRMPCKSDSTRRTFRILSAILAKQKRPNRHAFLTQTDPWVRFRSASAVREDLPFALQLAMTAGSQERTDALGRKCAIADLCRAGRELVGCGT